MRIYITTSSENRNGPDDKKGANNVELNRYKRNTDFHGCPKYTCHPQVSSVLESIHYTISTKRASCNANFMYGSGDAMALKKSQEVYTVRSFRH